MTSSSKSVDQYQIHNIAGLKAVQEKVRKIPLHLVAPQGQLQIHTASFRGSFSIVFSEALRTAGLGSKVLIAQFLKGGVLQGTSKGINLCGTLDWIRADIDCCISSNNKDQFAKLHQVDIKNSIEEVWNYCKNKLEKKEVDRLVLDEIGLAASLGFIDENDLISTLEDRPAAIDVILTGPSISSKIKKMANQITELR